MRGTGEQVVMRAPALILSAEERTELTRRKRAASSEQRESLRAGIVLRAAEGLDNIAVGNALGVTRKTVGKWRARFVKGRLVGLEDEPRSGRPSKLKAVARCEIIATACSFAPEARGVTSSAPQALQSGLKEVIRRFDGSAEERQRLEAAADEIAQVIPRTPKPEEEPARTGWTIDSLTRAVADAGIADVHPSTIWRLLNEVDLKPWTHKHWLHSPDPLFKEKATEICNLYLNPPPGSTTICVDEDCGIQVLERIHPSRPALPGQPARREYEYERHGTMGLIAGFEVSTGKVFGRFSETRTGADLLSFMEELAAWRPTGEIHIVWDNLNIHAASKWEEFNKRQNGRFRFHYTPIHASWLNQVECFFSIFSRRVLRLGDFSSVPDFTWKGRNFLSRWNEHEAHPFRWTFTGYPLQVGRETKQSIATAPEILAVPQITTKEVHTVQQAHP
jgi:transposase